MAAAPSVALSLSPSPFAALDAQRGVPVAVVQYPPGDAGIQFSLQKCAALIYRDSKTASARSFAGRILSRAGMPRTVKARMQALLDYVRANVSYAPDPAGTEMIQSAHNTLCIDDAMCIPLGDCDDMSSALGTLMQASGISTQLLKQTFGRSDQEHVLVMGQDESGDWLAADPSLPSAPVGRRAPASSEQWVDPADPKSFGLAAADAVFVGIGRPGFLGLSRHGLGAVDPYAQAALDLNNEVDVVIQAANTYLSEADFQGAITAYQAAGQAGASSVGPEIDLAGNPSATQPLTQKAWQLNAQLAALDPSTGGMTANQAQAFAQQMSGLYHQALTVGRTAATQPPGTAPPGAPSILTFGQAFALAVAGALAGGIVWHIARPTRRRRKSR